LVEAAKFDAQSQARMVIALVSFASSLGKTIS
jgi:hypothetical protein